jgi:PAS domain S-box-containing protein
MRKIKLLAEQAERERERLDAALTNMAQGLCMFDADQRLVVFNPRVAEIFKIPAGEVILGMSMRELMAMAQASDKDPEAADAEQNKLLAAPTSDTVITTLKDDTTLLITHRPMPNGGFVATFEDITDRLRAEEQIRHLAHFDALTDLPNRASIYEKLRELLSQLRRAQIIGVLSSTSTTLNSSTIRWATRSAIACSRQ